MKGIKNMNLPNKLTIFRVILIVPFVLLLLGGYQESGWFTFLFGGVLEYVDYIASQVNCQITYISVGPDRDQYIKCK